MTCRWVIREGRGFRYWALTTCKRGFNPLTRVNESGDIKKYYDGRLCPICGRKISCDTSLLIDAEEDENE